MTNVTPGLQRLYDLSDAVRSGVYYSVQKHETMPVRLQAALCPSNAGLHTAATTIFLDYVGRFEDYKWSGALDIQERAELADLAAFYEISVAAIWLLFYSVRVKDIIRDDERRAADVIENFASRLLNDPPGSKDSDVYYEERMITSLIMCDDMFRSKERFRA